jgi:hypothetical protein
MRLKNSSKILVLHATEVAVWIANFLWWHQKCNFYICTGHHFAEPRWYKDEL